MQRVGFDLANLHVTEAGASASIDVASGRPHTVPSPGAVESQRHSHAVHVHVTSSTPTPSLIYTRQVVFVRLRRAEGLGSGVQASVVVAFQTASAAGDDRLSRLRRSGPIGTGHV